MNPQIEQYLHVLFKERDWSWSLVALLYLFAGLTLRSWFLSPLKFRAKALSRKYYQHVKSEYLKRSLLGWIFFLLPGGILIFLWKQGILLIWPPTEEQKWLLLAALVSFIFSILLHLIALGIAGLASFKKYTDNPEML